ncbi:MAG: hypothetical protein K8T89_22745 [Planctomycetes bacterium]|nr:hypothetical protein [Planctomycetota bacterium]
MTSAEYTQTLKAASLFEIPNAGKLEVSGPDAPSFLHNLCTNDINNLPLGGGCEAYFCDQRAKVLAHVFIYHVLIEGGKHAFWLDVTPDFNEKLLKHLDRHLIAEQVELVDRTEHFTQFHLAGPKAKAVLEKALGESLPDLAEFLHLERTFGLNATCHLRRHDPLGVPGYDIVCLNERATGMREMLLAAGARLAGAETFETLRVEAVTPIYGIDIDETRFVMETPRALRAVSYAKGCYLGQEPIVMSRDRAGFVNRAFMAMKVVEGGPIVGKAKLLKDGADAGLITSSGMSPRLGPILVRENGWSKCCRFPCGSRGE